MVLLFCLSNLFIPTVLTIINERKGEQVVVYTYEAGIREFFEKLALPHVEIYFRGRLNTRRPYFYTKQRPLILKEMRAYDFKSIYFFHSSFGGFENWLITKLSSESQLFFVPIFNDLKFREHWSLQSIIEVAYSRFIYNTALSPLYNGQVYIYKIKDSFFAKTKAKTIKVEIDHTHINGLIGQIFPMSNHAKILLLTGTIVELNHVEEEEYTTKMDALIEYFGNDNIIVKAHPRYPNKFSREKELDEVPSFIPANVLLSRFDVFIGYTTSAVTEAAQSNRIGISLVDYLEPVSEERQRTYKNYLISNLNSGKVYFPKNLEELNDIVNNKIPQNQ